MIRMKTITNEHARQFILLKQGLIGAYRFIEKDGAYEYVRQAGCIQYDPVDVCGKNAELTLQSRVKGFKKSMLQDLLYKDRKLVDYADKELHDADDHKLFETENNANARSFAYGGKAGRSLDDSVQHFYDKLLLLKDEMNTEAAKEIARMRHEYMEGFLKEYYEEIRCE